MYRLQTSQRKRPRDGVDQKYFFTQFRYDALQRAKEK